MDQIIKVLAELVVYGGGSVAIAYLSFKFFAEKWIESKFQERLDNLKHQQALKLQRLRVEIDALLSGVLKLQEKEFLILPEAWAKLDEAKGKVEWIVAPIREHIDFDRMTPDKIDEFLSTTKFTDSQKQDIRSARAKREKFEEIDFWYRLSEVKGSFRELHVYLARNGIFLPQGIKENFSKISDMLWSAIATHQVGHVADDWKMKNEGWKKIKEDIEPLYKSIEQDIQTRLQAHGKVSK